MCENLILFCNCQARKDSPVWTETALFLELHREIQYFVLTDLCGFCVENPKKLTEMIENARNVLLISCSTRVVTLLLHQAGVENTEKIRYFNLLEDDQIKLVEVIGEFTDNNRTISLELKNEGKASDSKVTRIPCVPGKTLLKSDPLWPAWYPVIDYSRCNNCGQCADFCLFGVYLKSAGRVEVANPANCKNNCPACARICPSVAIVFPKYAGGGAIGGSDSINEKYEMQRLQQETIAILGDDIYIALEHRKMKRRSIIREESLQKAVKERDEALEQGRVAEKSRFMNNNPGCG